MKTDPSHFKQQFHPKSFTTVVMIYRLLIILLLFSSCQRKTVPVQDDVIKVELDTSLTLLTSDEIPGEALKDIHHLLELGYKKANKKYDSLRFQMYFDPELKDSIGIQTSGKDSVFLTIGNDQNKKVALYSYLDILGYRFYGPEDHWTFIPELQELPPMDTILHSVFGLRRFAPSFSVGPPSNKGLKNARFTYSRWMDRLRMANVLQLQFGHYGSMFNRKYKEEIIDHAEWRGKDKNGNVRPWSNNLKLCYSQPGVIELYKNDAKSRLDHMIQNQSPPYYLNMEPPDGGNHCHCDDCKLQPSPSDLVYGLVNQIAAYVNSLNPEAHVWLIAYNEHSPPPTFPLDKNVLVGLVPFGFQRNYSPTEFMDIWEKLHTPLFLRDYLAIPQWNFDSPNWQNGEQYLDRISHLANNGYIGFNFETTASFMSAGWPTYLISTRAWNDINYQQTLQLFQSQMFPTSNIQLEALINYLSDARASSYYFGNLEQIINSAKNSCEDPSEMDRLNDIEQYFRFLIYRNNYNTSTGGEKEDAKGKMMNYIYEDSAGLVLHSWGLYRTLIKNRKEVEFGQMVETKSPPSIPNFTLRSRKPIVKGYKPLYPDYHPQNIDAMPIVSFRNNPGSLVYVPDSDDLSIKIRVKITPANKSAGGQVRFLDDLGNELDSKIFDNNNTDWNDLTFIAPKGGAFYHLSFNSPGSRMYVQGPDRPFAFTSHLRTGVLKKAVTLWTYVERNRYIDIQFEYLTRQVTITNKNHIAGEFFVKDPIVYELKEAGEISIRSTKPSFSILNSPHLFSFSKHQLIKPVFN